MSRQSSVSSQTSIRTPLSYTNPARPINHSNRNGPDEKYQINEDLLYENDFPGETYVSAHLQRLQHGVYTDPNLHTKHMIHVTFASITFVMHSSHSLDHRFQSAIITIKAHGGDGEPIRFLKFAPHQAYGRISSESLKWNFQLGAQLGVTQGPAQASFTPSGGFEKDKVVGTMMKIQGSTRSTFNDAPFLEKKTRNPDTLLHWSLEENSQQEAGIPREFTFVFLMERKGPEWYPAAATHDLALSEAPRHAETRREKFGNALSMRLKKAKDDIKDGVKVVEEAVSDETEPMEYSHPCINVLPGERGMSEKAYQETFTAINFEICVSPQISGTLKSHLTTPFTEMSTVAGEVGQRFPTEGTDDSMGKEEHPEVMINGLYNFARMRGAFEDMVCLPGVSVGSRMPSLDVEREGGGGGK